MISEKKFLKKVFNLMDKKVDNVDFSNFELNVKDLSQTQKEIILQLKKIFLLKQNQRKILFYFDKNFDISKYKKQVDDFSNYLNEYNILTMLIKKYDYLNYGIIITKINKLLAKVK